MGMETTERDPKLLMDDIGRTESGEAPFFSKTPGSAYDKLVEKAFTRPVPLGCDLGRSVGVQVVGDPAPLPKVSTSISSVSPTPTRTGGTPPSSPPPTIPPPIPPPTPTPVSLSPVPQRASLVCNQCGESAMLADLYDGTRCPECPPRGDGRGRPYMQCGLCNIVRVKPRITCVKTPRQARSI